MSTTNTKTIGKSRIDAADLPRLCVALDVPLAYFFQDIVTGETFPNASQVYDMGALYTRLDDSARRVLVDVAMSLWQNQLTKAGGGKTRKTTRL